MTTPERLVLDAVRQALPSAYDGMVADWNRALDYADAVHARLPFAVAARRASWAERIPPSIARRLEEIEARERMVLALLDIELETALDALLGARIPVIVLKGADLARRYYPERILRPMGDADLLVPPESDREARRALEGAGFSATERRYGHSFRSAVARDGRPSIDLHVRLIGTDTPVRLARIWERSQAAVFSDLPSRARALSPEDCLIHVLRHGAILHVLEGPVWVNDLHHLILRVPTLDWELVLRELAATHARSAAWFVLGMLADHWGTPVPPGVLAELRRGVGFLRRAAAARRPELVDWFPGDRRDDFWMLRSRYLLREGPADALRYVHERWRRVREEKTADPTYP